MTTEQMRRDFESAVIALFNPGDNSLNLTPDRRYYNSVGTKSYGGRVNPEYAPVEMLWGIWQAAIASQQAAQPKCCPACGSEDCKILTHYHCNACKGDYYGIFGKATSEDIPQAAQPVAAPSALPTDWLRDDDLLYRMDEHGNNHDEIKVAMAGGRRDLDNRAEAARLLLAMFAAPPLPQVAEAGKLLTDVQSFTFMHSVLQWNRALPEPLIKVAYEYHVAAEIEKLYEAAHGIGPEQEGGK